MGKSSFRAGMFLLENLTSGMYNEPLSIYREYIQNAVDSFDLSKDQKNELSVNIDLDPFTKSIRIYDNGIGISSDSARDVLSSIGDSNKRNLGLRGFRGIGRLGGIAFCDKAIFRTKSDGETLESIQEWNCYKLKKYLELSKPLTFKQIFEKITKFQQKNGLPKKGGYFEVILYGVNSFRNHIFDIERVRNYLIQVAPIPFNSEQFSFGNKIEEFLSSNLKHYGKYQIKVNGQNLYKPYKDAIRTTIKKGGYDHIEGIVLFSIDIGNKRPAAYGWHGIRKDLIGSISRSDTCSGIRVRAGNILIGNSHLLNRCFREERFNSYVIGEIHIDSKDLIPNSRRDDFIDNESKTLFYNAVEKQIGLPISKEIRAKSRDNSNVYPNNSASCSDSKSKSAAINKSELPIKVKLAMKNACKQVLGTCKQCHNTDRILSILNNFSYLSSEK